MTDVIIDKLQLIAYVNHIKYSSIAYFDIFLNYCLDDFELNEIMNAKKLIIDNKKYKIIRADYLNDLNETKLIIEYEYK